MLLYQGLPFAATGMIPLAVFRSRVEEVEHIHAQPKSTHTAQFVASAFYTGLPLAAARITLSWIAWEFGYFDEYAKRCWGALQGSTRLLVTHQRQHLPACDRIVVLRDGRIVADGTYAELQVWSL